MANSILKRCMWYCAVALIVIATVVWFALPVKLETPPPKVIVYVPEGSRFWYTATSLPSGTKFKTLHTMPYREVQARGYRVAPGINSTLRGPSRWEYWFVYDRDGIFPVRWSDSNEFAAWSSTEGHGSKQEQP